MLHILGSIVETSLKNMYVRKPIKEEYTFETEIYKATSQSMRADDPPKLAPPSLALSVMDSGELDTHRAKMRRQLAAAIAGRCYQLQSEWDTASLGAAGRPTWDGTRSQEITDWL